MAFDAFLNIDGIPGESTDTNHDSWIEILSYSHGVSQPTSLDPSAHGGRSSGRVDMSDFSIVKALDKASPKIALACCKGTHVATVVVELCRAGGDKQKYMEYKLTDVLVASVRPGGSSHAEGLPLEEVGFRFGKIDWTYTQLDKAGASKGNVAANWDLATNTGA